MIALLAAAYLHSVSAEEIEDALRLSAAEASCDLYTLREERFRVRVEVAKETRPERQRRLWEEFDRIQAAIVRCGERT